MKTGINGEIIVSGTVPAEVTISRHEQIEVALAVIKKHYGLCNGRDYYHYINDSGEDLMLCTDHGHHRGGEVHERVRPATVADKAALLVMRQLENSKCGPEKKAAE